MAICNHSILIKRTLTTHHGVFAMHSTYWECKCCGEVNRLRKTFHSDSGNYQKIINRVRSA